MKSNVSRGNKGQKRKDHFRDQQVLETAEYFGAHLAIVFTPWPKLHGRLLRRPLIPNHHSKPTLMRVFKPYKGYFWRQVAKLMPLLYQILLLVLWDSKSDNLLTKWLRNLQQEHEVQKAESGTQSYHLTFTIFNIGMLVHIYLSVLISTRRRPFFGHCETSRKLVDSFGLDPALCPCQHLSAAAGLVAAYLRGVNCDPNLISDGRDTRWSHTAPTGQ